MGRIFAFIYGLAAYLTFFAPKERNLIEMFGDKYPRYRERISMLTPWRRSAPPARLVGDEK